MKGKTLFFKLATSKPNTYTHSDLLHKIVSAVQYSLQSSENAHLYKS